MGRTAGAQILLFMREAECQWYYETRTPKKPNPVKCVGGIPKHENANVQIRKRTRAEPEGTKDSTVTDLPSESEEAEPPESWCISDEAEAEVTTESESAAQANSARVVNKPVSDSFAGKIGKRGGRASTRMATMTNSGSIQRKTPWRIGLPSGAGVTAFGSNSPSDQARVAVLCARMPKISKMARCVSDTKGVSIFGFAVLIK